jgi:VCBS repeat-containing protein
MATNAAAPIFAPGTTDQYVREWIDKLNNPGDGNSGQFNAPGQRWTNPVGGAGSAMGDTATVTWSIVPDGTLVADGVNGGSDKPSNLIAFLDGIYGGGTGSVSQRPWFPLVQRAYDQWSQVSGISYVFEPNDDGVATSGNGNRGVAGVRGDVRIAGIRLDGNFGVLAYNYFPNNGGNNGFDGDMVIDTADRFYGDSSDGASGENRGLINVLMHEAGHGHGLLHVIPTNETKLMEPFVSDRFYGAQHDDILGVQQLYGDRSEPNDTVATASNLGALSNGTFPLTLRSLDNNNDLDFYQFSVNSAGKATISVTPQGQTYSVGPQGGTASTTNSLIYKDLVLELLASDGTVLALRNAGGAGVREEILDFDLPAGGTYRIRVSGTGAALPQLYDLSIRIAGTSVPVTAQNPPRLLSVAANYGENFGVNRINVLSESPRELVFRFDGAQSIDPATFSGIRIYRAGEDGSFNTADDILVTPAWIGHGDNERVVIARFAETLPDDVYRIEILGVDLASEGRSAIRNTEGEALRPRRAGTDRDTYYMNLELGARVVAVVPEPVERTGSALTQRKNQIDIYFNNDPLHDVAVTTSGVNDPTVVTPAFYQLIMTQDTTTPNDDVVILPTSVSYDPVTNKAVLTFAQAISSFGDRAETFRLRVGSREVVPNSAAPSTPTIITPAADPGDTLVSSTDLGTLAGSSSFILREEVRAGSGRALPDYPGSNFDPGHRDIQDESHQGGAPDADPDITVLTYTFALGRSYGVDTAGRPLFSTISPDQMQRVREIFEFYAAQMGINFVETEGAGDLTVVVGDMAPLNQQSGPGGVIGVASGSLAIMDYAEAWDNTFGFGANIPNTQSFFMVAMHEIGHMLGLGHAYDQPAGTVMGGLENSSFVPTPVEWFFPGDVDVIHGQHLYRPDNRDVDIYRFVVPAGEKGAIHLETLADRLAQSSQADTHLTLMERTPTGLKLLAVNDNYFGKDSFIRLDLDSAASDREFFVAVTVRGNSNFNALAKDTGSGGTTSGNYELRLDFRSTLVPQIVDSTNTPLDGDGDGTAGGNFNFWFRSAPESSTQAPGAPKTLFVDKGYTGAISNGSLAQPFRSLPQAIAASREGDIIRVAGSLGADGQLLTTRDNPAYEIGTGGTGNATLSDGKSLEVPKGVTLMIDAGAIFKMGGSAIIAGSSDASSDRSGGAVQVLGTPVSPVYFTSYKDESLGTDTNPLATVPAPGDWGGIETRLDVDRAQGRRDREREGVFLNYIAFADMAYGGGQFGQGSLSRVVTPVQMTESRATLLNNRFRNNADAGISADPNSFEYTTFSEPRYHIDEEYTLDYNRVGPVLQGNKFENNSINALRIRIDTLAGQALKPLTLSARLDDTDITYFLGENLIIQGTPGGPILETVRPDLTLIQQNPSTTTTGSLTAGETYNYVMTYVDIDGGEGVASLPTNDITATGTGAILLTQLPAATGDFVARRLWRSQPGGFGPYELVAQLNKDAVSYTDTGISLGGALDPTPNTSLRARRDASLVIDPGVVIKSLGARIELGIRGNLIAEGSKAEPIIFTSRLDDRYGAGGTLDTNNDGTASVPAPGDWSGIVARHLSTLSIDTSLITHAGGVSSVPGGFATFNALEIHQATARLSRSVLESNASGAFGPGSTNRDSRGPNDEAVIYVVGSQSILIDNIIRNNASTDTAAISIDANSLKATSVVDFGNQVGVAEFADYGLGNMGPLVQKNRLGNNAINGMRVRGATLTTESIWDDTDIVHVLQSSVIVPDFHTYGGLRLQSKVNESLVVKLQGSSAGFEATGRPLDMPTRIGGSLQVIGSPGFPVILTSLLDDSIGAGFDPSGRPQSDTDGAGTTVGRPGDWRSIRISPYSNDRNVDTTFELEADKIQDRAVNDIPDNAQELGQLANTLRGGDENLRLGFTVHGSIAAPSDLDVYQFTATAGTMVWIDVDRTSGGLDSVVELIDQNGQILALSDNSLDDSILGTALYDSGVLGTKRVLPMDTSIFAYRNALIPEASIDFQSVNPLDAGMRLVLPGVAGSINPYFIRVRSSSLPPDATASDRLWDPAEVRGGVTIGAYRMQLRLQQTDEVGGSTVRFADVRFATNGIELLGQPLHSPLLGETGELPDPAGNPNEQPAGATPIGNIANSDRSGISIAAALTARTDVDWFRFRIQRDSIQTPGDKHIATSFDIDYADGLGRPDTTLWIFRDAALGPELVLLATDSDIADDRARPGQGADADDLSRGSFGSRDAFLGSIELPDGDYFVAVSNSSIAYNQMSQFSSANTTAPNLRVEPLDGFTRYSEDRFDNVAAETAFGPKAVAFTGSAADVVPWTLSDVTLFTARNNGTNGQFFYVNPLTGVYEANVSDTNTFRAIEDLAVQPNGTVKAFEYSSVQGTASDANSGTFFTIDGADTGTVVGNYSNSQIQTFQGFPDPNDPAAAWTVEQAENGNGRIGHGMRFTAIGYGNFGQLGMFGVASRGNGQTTYRSVNVNPADGAASGGPFRPANNILYQLDPTSGFPVSFAGAANRAGAFRAQGAGTQIREAGRFNTNNVITGITAVDQILYAVSDAGEFFVVDPTSIIPSENFEFGPSYAAFNLGGPQTILRDDNGDPIEFTSLSTGPRNVSEGRYAQTLFGVTATGTLYAFDIQGNPAPVFTRGRSNIQVPAGISGIDFSAMDENLWHLTDQRADNAGHGQPRTFNGSRPNPQGNGGNSLRFGFPQNPAGYLQGDWTGIYDLPSQQGTYDMPGGAWGAVESQLIDLRGYSADDQPMLYFNYLLQTETKNSPNNDGDNWMRDAFRVYAGTPDGQWILLGTNNSSNDNNYNNGNNEFDPGVSLYTDAFGKNYKAQEVFDTGEAGYAGNWRQSRISLAPVAGMQDVRIRFEFSSQGDMRSGDPVRGGVELMAVVPTALVDGDTFSVLNVQDGTNSTFEFDMGLVLNMPSGQSIPDGATITVEGTVFTFVFAATGAANEVVITPDMTPLNVAGEFRKVLERACFEVRTNTLSPNILNIKGGTTAAGPHSVGGGLDSNLILGFPGVSIGNEPVDIHQEYPANYLTLFDAVDSDPNFGGGPAPSPILQNPLDLLGAPDYIGGAAEPSATNTGAFSLGNGGQATISLFPLNWFTSSGDSRPDLFIQEVGLPEDLFVEISEDGVTWIPVGMVGGCVVTVDLDAFGITPDVQYTFIRLTDDINQGPTTGPSVGADIDAVGTFFNAYNTEPQARLAVRDAIRVSLAQALNVAGQEDNIDVWDVYNDTVRLYGYQITDLGKLGGLIDPRAGDSFESDPQNRRDQRAQNNRFEGVYIDDILIGFAERGEMVSGAVVGTFNNFDVNSLLAAGGLPYTGQSLPVEPIETGTYQLEIRTSAEYGITGAPNELSLSPLVGARAFDTNERLAKQSSIVVTQASAITDGTTFTLSDGFNEVVFEFDVNTSAADPASGVAQGHVRVLIDPGFNSAQVAAAIRDAINIPSVQALLSISASTNDKLQVKSSQAAIDSSMIYLHGSAAGNLIGSTDLPASLSFFLYGVDSALGEDLGDSNRLRDQGQMIISSTFVRDSAQVGILVDSANRNQLQLAADVGPRPYPGTPRNLLTLNTALLAPGAVIVNNVLANNGTGGLVISGDQQAGQTPAARSITRAINNTVVGNGSGTGIQVNQGAAPDLINNIVTGFTTGVAVDAASSTVTVLGANLFKSNASNVQGLAGGGNGSFPIFLGPNDPLFTSLTNGRYYLAPLSRAIDSSLASLQERSALSQVKNSMSLPSSPMISPSRDIGGLLRIDDPAVNTPGGQGQNVFIDRGAVDRTDFVGPTATLLNPLDNDADQVDIDRNTTYVRLLDGNLSYFSILLDESQGTGPDPATVTAQSVMLTENGRLLIPDVDYVFGYSVNSREIRLTPNSGFWRRDSVYEITLNNARRLQISPTNGLGATDGNQMVATLSDGSQVFMEYESGYILSVPRTSTIIVPATGSGPAGIVDGQRIRITNGATVGNFEFDTDGTVSPGFRRISIPPIGSAGQIRDAILLALQAPSNSDLNLAPKAVGADQIHLGTLAVHTVDVSGASLQLVGDPGGVTDGQTLVITRAGGSPLNFEYDLPSDGPVASGRLPIAIERSDTYDDIARKTAAALAPYFTDGFSPVTAVEGGFVHVGGKPGDAIVTSGSRLALSGTPGVTESLQLTVPTAGGPAIPDGARFSIRIGTTSVVFEFTKDLVVGTGNQPISIRNTDTAAQVASKIVAAINIAGLGLTSQANGSVITLNEPLGTVLNLLTSGLTSTGVPGGAVPVNFIPAATFTKELMAAQWVNSLRRIGLGVDAFLVGNETVLVDGVQQISGVPSIAIDAIRDYAGNPLQANRANSLTQFTIVMPEMSLDYGDAPGAGSQTMQSDNGSRHAILPEDEPYLVLGQWVDADADGQPDSSATGDDYDSLMAGTLPLSVGTTGPAVLEMPGPAGLVGRTIVIRDPARHLVTFEFTNSGSASIPGAVAVNLTGALTPTDVATRFTAAVLGALTTGRIDDLIPIQRGPVVDLGGTPEHLFDLSNASSVTRVQTGSLSLLGSSNIAAYADGQTWTIQDGAGGTVTWELHDSSTGPVSVTPGNLPFAADLTVATAAQVMQSLQAAIVQAISNRQISLPAPTLSGTQLTIAADDEDGVRFTEIFNSRANPTPVVVTSSGTGMLDAWFDWNNDGDFQDAGEQMLKSTPVRSGDNTFLILPPASASTGFLAARFRLSATGALLTNGVGIGGEVEDYLIEVLPGTPPVAVSDTYSVDEDQVLLVAPIGVLTNDTDADAATTLTVFDSDPLVPGIQPERSTEHGSLQLNSDGSFTYAPDLDYFGTDSFVYYAYDGRMKSNLPTTVTINVRPVNDAPTAVDDTASMIEDTTIVLPGSSIWGNDIKGPPNEAVQNFRLVGAVLVDALQGGNLQLDTVLDELRYTPRAHQNDRTQGPILIRVTVEDYGAAGGDANPLRSTATLTINIAEINDAPTFTMPTSHSSREDQGLVTVPNFITSILPGPAEATDEVTIDQQKVTFRVRAFQPSLFAVQPTIDATGTLTYQLAQHINNNNPPPTADLLVEVIAEDDGVRTPPPNDHEADAKIFVINANPVNDAPEFTLNSLIVNTLEDAGPQTVAGFASGIRPGPAGAADEANQSLEFLVVVPTNEVSAYTRLPAIDPTTGNLTYQLAPDVNSRFPGLTLTFTVQLRDSGPNVPPHDVNVSPISTVTIRATEVNDTPGFTLPSVTVNVLEDNEAETAVAQTVIPNFATNITFGPSTALDEPLFQTLSFIVLSNTNPTLFASGPTIDAVGTLRFVTAKDQNGQAVIVINLQDQENVGPPDTRISPNRTFTINIRPVNDAPEFTIPATAPSVEDQGLVRIPGFATNMRPGPNTAFDELNTQTFTVNVVARDPSKFAVQPSIDATGTLTYRTAADVNSSAAFNPLEVDVFLVDDGASTPPDINQSVTRTFRVVPTPVNDAPQFTLPNRQLTIIEDREEFLGIVNSEFVGFATNVLPGPATAIDELNQSLTFDVTNSAPELFAVQPRIDVINGTGTLVFKTAPNKNGRATVVVRLRDNGASSPAPNTNTSGEQTITITIDPINDAPLFDIPATLAVDEDAGVRTVSGFATNIQRGPAGADDESVQEVTFFAEALDPTAFEIQPTIEANGNLTFKTAKDVNNNTPGKDLRVRVYLVDNGPSAPPPNNNRSVNKTVSLDIRPVNDPPIPGPHVVNIAEETSIVIQSADILATDLPGPIDELGQSLRITQVERTSDRGGTISPTFTNGAITSFRYTPGTNVVGFDTFRYVVTDDGNPNRSATGTITITIDGVNDPPQFTPGPSVVTVDEDAPTVSQAWATNILPGPAGAVDEANQTVSFTVSASPSSLFSQGPSIDSNGVLTFTPAPDANGTALVEVQAVDSGSNVPPSQNSSAKVTLTIQINPVNDPPVFTSGPNVRVNEDSGAYSAAWATGKAAAAGLLLTPPRALDEASQVVTYSVTTNNAPLFGVQPTVGEDGTLRFTPASNAHGTALVYVTAVDNGPSNAPNQNRSVTQTLTVTIDPVNDAPVAVDDSFSTNEDTLLTIPRPGVLANDLDVDLPNDALTAVQVSATSILGATVVLNADGSFSYDPRSVNSIQALKEGETVVDRFTYRARDLAGALSDLANVSITVRGINDAPVARDDNFVVSPGTANLLPVLDNDTDVDSPIDEKTIVIGAVPINGTVRVLQTGRVEYRPNAGFRGNDSFSYRVRDIFGALSNEAFVYVSTNNPPVAVNDAVLTGVNQPVDINLIRNDYDLDGTVNPNSVQIVVLPTSGSVQILGNGVVRFTPGNNFVGTAKFAYTIQDNEGSFSNVAEVTVQVTDTIYQNPVNRFDVNGDGFVSPIDALLIINDLNLNGPRPLPPGSFTPPPYLDVNGSNSVEPSDALQVINYLNLMGNGEGPLDGEGEGEAVQIVSMVSPAQMISAVGPQVVRDLRQSLLEAALATEKMYTVPAMQTYRDGLLDRPDSSAEAIETLLDQLTWEEMQEDQKEKSDELFRDLDDDLLN